MSKNNIEWFCDNCEALLNNQDGFTTKSNEWVCTICGMRNDVSEHNVGLHCNENKMFHVISAKKMGWDGIYDYIYFPTSRYSMDDAIAQFVPVMKETLRNNHWVTYTAYEYDGEMYYEIIYSGVVHESEL